jgi:hypothetical protein
MIGCVPRLFANSLNSTCAETVPKPICLGRRKLQFERKQLPQVVDIRHIRIESMERLEPANILRNQQVAGSIPAGGSIKSGT